MLPPTKQNKEDTPKATLLNIVVSLVVKAIQFFIKRSMNKKAKAQERLSIWRDSYVQKRNARIDRVNLVRSVDELCDQKNNNKHLTN